MQVIDNFLPTWLHNRVKMQLLDPMLDWHFPSFGGDNTDLAKSSFAKQPFDLVNRVNDWHRTDSLTYALDYWLEANQDYFELDHLHRCMINFYTPSQNTGWHVDMHETGYYSLLYYVNESDGGTMFEDRKILHKENSALFFDSTILHSPMDSTVPRRISVNWILKGRLKNGL